MGKVKNEFLRNCDYEIKEQDRYLPLANVGRVMKKALPEYAKLSKEAKTCIQECASEFISFITSQAADKCLLEKRKTMNGEDILWSMFVLGFENYAETLKIYLAKYREYEQEQALKKPPRIRKKKSKSFEEEDYIRYGDDDIVVDEEEEEEDDDDDDDQNLSNSDGSDEYNTGQSGEYNYELNDDGNDFNIKSISDKYIQPGIPELLPNLTNIDDYIDTMAKFD